MRAYGIFIIVLAACSAPGAEPDAATTDASPERKVPVASDAGDDAAVTGPEKLSETGLYSDIATRALAPSVIAYTPRWPVWSDGAVSHRYVSLPSGMQIDTSAMDDWSFPVGTKMWKDFSAGGTLYETRFSWKKPEGWWVVSYAWLADGSDAIAAPEGVDDALGTGHEIPPQEDCVECHSQVRDVGIGVSAMQLGASDGDGTLSKLVAMSALSTAPAKAAYDVPGTGVTKDALGYLHGNCAHCHNDSGSLRFQTQMRLRVRVSDETPEETEVYRTSPYLVMKHPVPATDIVYTIVPGNPSETGLLVRISLRGGPNDPDGNPYQMPPVGTNVVDDAGVASVSAWLSTMRCGWCQSMIAPQ